MPQCSFRFAFSLHFYGIPMLHGTSDLICAVSMPSLAGSSLRCTSVFRQVCMYVCRSRYPCLFVWLDHTTVLVLLYYWSIRLRNTERFSEYVCCACDLAILCANASDRVVLCGLLELETLFFRLLPTRRPGCAQWMGHKLGEKLIWGKNGRTIAWQAVCFLQGVCHCSARWFVAIDFCPTHHQTIMLGVVLIVSCCHWTLFVQEDFRQVPNMGRWKSAWQCFHLRTTYTV